MLQNRNDCFAAFFFSEKEIDKSVYKVYILIYTVKAQLTDGKNAECGKPGGYEAVREKRGICMLKVERAVKQIGDFKLGPVSIELSGGYIMGLIGQNGSGKTTLLHLIAGLLRPKEGDVSVFGKSYQTSERAIREELGVVLQERMFEAHRTLEENGNDYGKYYENYRREKLLYRIERFGLIPKQKYKNLSKGEELKFQLAFALAHEPKLLLLDEPTANFDPEFREEFFLVLKEFIADGAHSVILATHLTEDLDRIADYITWLEKGKQLFSTDIENLRDMYRMAAGEHYKVMLLPQENIICMEQGSFGTKALVRHKRRLDYHGLETSRPSLEELMYFITRRKNEPYQ